MNINVTLIGQMITFALLVIFTMKYVWPPIIKAMEERQKHIADGLAASERGKHELELAEQRVGDILRDAKGKAAEIISQAEKRAAEIGDQAKVSAKAEAERILHSAQADIDQEINRAKEQLRATVSELAVLGASKILEKEIDAKAHAKLIDSLAKQL